MKTTDAFSRPALVCVMLALAISAVGCQQGGGYSASQRDPIGPAPVGIPSPGIGAPGGQSIDTRGSGSVASSEGEATLANPTSSVGSGRGAR